MPEPTIGAGWPKAFLEFAVSEGGTRPRLLNCSGLQEADLIDQDGRVPLSAYIALIEAGIESTGDDTLALRFGEMVRMEDVTIVALLGAASETVGECFAQISRFARLMIDAGQSDALAPSRIVEEPDGLWIVTADDLFCRNPYLEQISLAQSLCGWRRVMQGQIHAETLVHVLQALPPYADDFERVLGAPIVFNAGRNAVRVPRDFLSIRFPAPNRYIFSLLSERAESILSNLRNGGDTRSEVQREIAARLHTGMVGVEAIANALGVSRRTLHRRLKAEGCTFEQVLDELRRDLAHAYLQGKKVSVNETAYLIGYSEAAAFSRAFKRWTGANPSSLRTGRR